jgi:hypothetical protein
LHKRYQQIRGPSFLLIGRWCDIIVLNNNAPTKDKTDDVRGNFYGELESVFDKLPKYHMNILLEDFSAKLGREGFFKSTTENQSSHEISKENGVRGVNFATSKNLTVKTTMSPHRNDHKYTWTSADGKTHHQVDHILIERQRHSSVLDVRSFRAADCDTDHYQVVANVRERVAVNKQISQSILIDRFNLKKVNEVEGKEQYRVEVSNRFAALEDLDAEVDINSAWETIRENIKISAKNNLGYYEFKKHKFDEGCSELLHQRKQVKL